MAHQRPAEAILMRTASLVRRPKASACEKKKYKYHMGLTASASGFYGAQGRKIPGIPLRFPNLQDEMTNLNVANFEMESSTLFTLCNVKGVRSSTICAIYAARLKNKFIDQKTKKKAEKACIVAGLDAFTELEKMDKQKKKKKKKYWHPGLK